MKRAVLSVVCLTGLGSCLYVATSATGAQRSAQNSSSPAKNSGGNQKPPVEFPGPPPLHAPAMPAAPGAVSGLPGVPGGIPYAPGNGTAALPGPPSLLETGAPMPSTIVPKKSAEKRPQQPLRITAQTASIGVGGIGHLLIDLGRPAPKGGAQIKLSSSNPALIRVPAQIVLPQGGTFASIALSPRGFQARASVILTATYADSRGTASAESSRAVISLLPRGRP